MRKTTSVLVLGTASILLTSCASHLSQSQYKSFTKRPDYRQTRDVFKHEGLLKKANSSNTTVRVDLSDQRAQLLVDDKVAMDLPCSTGKAGKRTPVGSFTIGQKLVNKRSTIFGSLYKNGRRVYRGDRRKYRGRYHRYVGASLPYWMRVTNGGIGMHY
ncbi:MAG: L,D-transpeptidase, partial [Verrucomicrobiae bacterium]|nr:L,D-transpeptidase [Verrucomicrobiae bacterium]NNJ86370.1 L,D-transpeptidase [Akkermansiaceae bacterium]